VVAVAVVVVVAMSLNGRSGILAVHVKFFYGIDDMLLRTQIFIGMEWDSDLSY
jgi:hypothetical protein